MAPMINFEFGHNLKGGKCGICT